MDNRVLLINAPYIDVYGPIKLAAGRYFPLGLGYIASVLRENKFDVRLIDPEAQHINLDNIAKIIMSWSPGIIGISSATPNFSNAVRIADIAKGIDGGIKVVIGGIHASALPEFVLSKSHSIDIVVIGEGEYAMLEICRANGNGAISYGNIHGLAYRQGNKIVFSPPRLPIQDIDTLPFPARDLIDVKNFYPNLFNAKRRVSAGMITSRGCPFKCYFCASNITMGSRYRPHSARRVFEELALLVKRYNVRQVLFSDDTFSLNRQRVFDVCELILKNKLKIDWHCLSRVSDVNKEMLKIMKRAGCFSIGFGVESGDEEILKGIGKGITIEQAHRAFTLCRKAGINTQAFFVFGNKNETMSDIDKSIKLAKELKPRLCFFNILTPYPGTRAFEDIKTKKIEEITNWEDFVAIGPKAATEVGNLSNRQLLDVIYKANRKFYLRPLQLLKILFSFSSFYEFKQYLKGGFALVLQMFVWNRGRKT